jgi:hypothetical protein
MERNVFTNQNSRDRDRDRDRDRPLTPINISNSLINACKTGDIQKLSSIILLVITYPDGGRHFFFELDRNGMSAVMYAIRNMNVEILRIIKNMNYLPQTFSEFKSVLIEAIKTNNEEIICLVLNWFLTEKVEKEWLQNNNPEILHMALQSKNFEIINQILKFYNTIIPSVINQYSNDSEVNYLLTKKQNKKIYFDYILNKNKTWLEACSNVNTSETEIKNYIASLGISTLNDRCQFLNKNELCSLLREYHEYILFNKEIGNEPEIVWKTENEINGWGSSGKTILLTHNTLPLIYKIEIDKDEDSNKYFFESFVIYQMINLDQSDTSLLDINGYINNNEDKIVIKLFWSYPENLYFIKKFKNKRHLLKGLGQHCMCLLFNYLLKKELIHPNKKVELDAGGGKCKKNSMSDENITTTLKFIEKYNKNFSDYLSKKIAGHENLILRIRVPESFELEITNPIKYLCAVFDNIKLTQYYERYGLLIDEEYYFRDNTTVFDPLLIRMISSVTKVLQACQ